MAGFLRRVWKPYAIEKILQMNRWVFLVRFRDEKSFEVVVNKFGLHFDNKPMVVVPWTSGCKIEKKEATEVDVWVQFPGLSVKYWNVKVLSKLASQIGVPLEMDDLMHKGQEVVLLGCWLRYLYNLSLKEWCGIYLRKGA